MSSHLDVVELDPEWFLERPLFDWRLWFRCRVKILVVTDASGSFDQIQGFGLGKVLDVVKADLWPHVVFDFTTAHRGGGPADKTGFQFDAEDLTQYHQIWLFGVARGAASLSQSELRALTEFMDNGGGVFATGDHEDLGVDLCGEVPRVRSMRRWYHPNAGPNGEAVAPDQTGPGRHDTLTDDPSTPAIEASQTDKVPQKIRPRSYWALYPSGIFGKFIRYPHPVLCGPLGPITHLPDHMHEGLIEVPADLTQQFTFDGYTTDEYPTVGGTHRPPQVIAWATNFVTGADFGVLGAYDGHPAGVGRVVVDATWHHWFNINMDPYLNASTPGHPTYDANVVPKWEEMKAFFRNVAAWLSPPSMQHCLRNGGWLFTLGYYDIVITLQDPRKIRNLLPYYWQLGVFAKDALGRIAPQCQTIGWLLFDLVEDLQILRVPQLWDPQPEPPGAPPDPSPFIDFDDLTAVLLGGAVHALARETDDRNEDAIRKLLESDAGIPEVARRGAREALNVVAERYRESCGWFDQVGAARQAE